MTIKGWVIGLGIMAGLICKGLAQVPPSNDNYTNRTGLSGTDVTFSGTLTGATIESYRETVQYGYLNPETPTKSVWWGWTAPVSTDLTVEMVSSSLGTGFYQGAAALLIYYQTNATNFPNSAPLGQRRIDFRLAPLTLSIPVIAGSNYIFQLIGTNSANYTFRLLATNLPVIVEQPKSQTVYSNACALLYVIASGPAQTNFGFQWYFNGSTLVGETAPMLALTNIDSTMAGAYTVAVSNAVGVTLSQPAFLSVSTTNVPIILGTVPATNGSFGFSLLGESGRKYRIQASTDGLTWANAVYFPEDPFFPTGTSVVWSTNTPRILVVSNDAHQKLFRATPYTLVDSNAEICVNNLRKLRVAKILFQRDYTTPILAIPIDSQLLPYLPHQASPHCPLDIDAEFQTSYPINNNTSAPICEISTNHICDDPN